MPRTAVTITDPTRAGGVLGGSNADVANGNHIDNPDRCIIWLNNQSGGAINVTLQYNGTWDGLAVSGRVLSIPSGAIQILGGLKPSSHYQEADSGRLYLDGASSSLIIAAIRFPVGAEL
jgi:hypothetical protein